MSYDWKKRLDPLFGKHYKPVTGKDYTYAIHDMVDTYNLPIPHKRIDALGMSDFVWCVNPTCKDKEYYIKWMFWFHVFDDYFDRPLHEQQVLNAIAPFIHHLKGFRSLKAVDEPLLPYYFSFIELYKRINNCGSDWFRMEFSHRFILYLKTLIVENRNKTRNNIFQPNDLLEHKRSCMAQDLTLLLDMLDIGFTDMRETYECLDYYIDWVCDVTGTVNDILSYEKELEVGDYTNFVLCYMKYFNSSLDDAVIRTCEFIESSVKNLMGAYHMWYSDPDDNYKIIMDHCKYWALGYYHWAIKVRRFNER